MIFHISSRTGVPPYLQIVQQVRQDVRLGLLKAGDKLPAVREVVTMIAINPNTVVKAYRELEKEGFIEKRTGIGTFVCKQPAGPSQDTQTALIEKLYNWIDEAKMVKLDEDSMEALFNKALHKKREERHEADNKE